MQIRLDKVLSDNDGNPLADPWASAEPKPPLTVGRLLIAALIAPHEGETNLSGDAKFARGVLAMSLRDQDSVDITVEELAVVIRLVKAFGTPLLLAQIIPILDPAAQPGRLA